MIKIEEGANMPLRRATPSFLPFNRIDIPLIK